MSMSEFEGQKNSNQEDFLLLSTQKHQTPDDFTEEDLEFAKELGWLFTPEEEDLPPYYVQTLLEAEDQRFQPVEHGFELKTSSRVFRRLKLRRKLYHSHFSPLSIIITSFGDKAVRRSLGMMLASFTLLMIFTVAFTGGAFASGMAILLRGGQGGIYQVPHYPNALIHKQKEVILNESVDQPKEISMLAAQQQMHFPIYWPQYIPEPYSLQKIFLYQNVDQQWADGPILEFEYDLAGSGIVPKGTGEVVVREFKPKEDVLQLVEDGAAFPIEIDHNGSAKAIYVDGQWAPRGHSLPQWIRGGRSELIYQQDGVVFWIVGDQRDNIGENELLAIAQNLQVFYVNHAMHMEGEMRPVTQLVNDDPGTFNTDVIVIFPEDGGDGPYYLNVSSYQSSKNGQHQR